MLKSVSEKSVSDMTSVVRARTARHRTKRHSHGKGEVNFPILYYADHKIIDAYGLRDPAYEGQKFDGIPASAVYVINKTGRVSWVKID